MDTQDWNMDKVSMDGPSANTLSESHVVHLMNRAPHRAQQEGKSRREKVQKKKEKVKNYYCLNCSSNVYHLWSVTNPSLLSYIHCRFLFLLSLFFSLSPLFISSSFLLSFALCLFIHLSLILLHRFNYILPPSDCGIKIQPNLSGWTVDSLASRWSSRYPLSGHFFYFLFF